MKRIGQIRIATILGAAALLGFVSEASAQKRNPLKGQPAVRRRYIMNSGRIEIVPMSAISIAADLKHTIAPGAKIEYKLNDWIWLGGTIGFGAVNFNTGLFDRTLDTLPTTTDTTGEDRAPTKDQANKRARTIGLMADAHVSFSPWFGKMGLLSRFFLQTDLFFTGGWAFIGLQNDVGNVAPTLADGDPRNDSPPTNGTVQGPMFGAGMHFWFNKFLALNVEFRDYIFKDNASGFNTTTKDNLLVNDDDLVIQHHPYAIVGISIYFPFKVKVSR